MDNELTPSTRRGVFGGFIAGLIGGVVVTCYLVITAAIGHQDVWQVLKTAGAPVMSARAFAPGFDALAILVGVVCHFAVSVVWGVLFGMIAFGLTRATTMVLSVVWGLVAWMGMAYVVLPIAGLDDVAAHLRNGMAILSHVVFGITLGLGFLPYQQTRPRVRPSTPHVASL